MPLQKGGAIFVVIDGIGSHRILWVEAHWEFPNFLKNVLPTMLFCHGFQQQIDNLGMKIIAYQDSGGRPKQRNVASWNAAIDIKHPLWEYELHQIWKHTTECLGHRKTQEFDVRIC